MLESETKKLLLNSVTGNYQNEYSWLYSPFAVMQIRMNGQLVLLMLCERLMELGATIIQINTDGVLYRIKKAKYDHKYCNKEFGKAQAAAVAEKYESLISSETDPEIIKQLEEWRNNKNRKPLILSGARQELFKQASILSIQ